jgi:hypothetical protein
MGSIEALLIRTLVVLQQRTHAKDLGGVLELRVVGLRLKINESFLRLADERLGVLNG